MRLFSFLLLTLALLLSPIGMSGMAMASASTAGAMKMGHCDAPASAGHEQKPPVQKADCMSLCSAVSPDQPLLAGGVPPARSADEPVPAAVLTGLAPESATPPPRRS